MQKRLTYHILIFSFLLLFSSCEDLIDVDLNKTDPRIVIVADINNEEKIHEILVSRTVDFDEPIPYEPILNATVYIQSKSGRTYYFNSAGEGKYRNSSIALAAGETYTLVVMVDDEEYKSTTTMLPFIDVESIGVNQETLLNETYYFINLKFFDPTGQANYYRYSISRNGEAFKSNAVFSDKFNDGNEVTHQLGREYGNEIKPGDQLLIRRFIISKESYNYWSEYMSTNPGSAAPGNPTSNIDNGAMGYFSVSSARDYKVEIAKPSDE
ncbi:MULTISPECIES: DUF4249 domain-containing protein [Sphingobacterium]|uniref:DUF4249 domain-containing protein n=1 Tax=Sphingobacterium TaxID=28453 RepID=UPI00240DEA05|nr:DUF4249 domain-containing protein [Sphingobacterium sp. WM]WFB65048.1 DUF4249 domain-containing protein [Sphingobacterium sp. WM]